jgi:para-nitrobenzyl esterase
MLSAYNGGESGGYAMKWLMVIFAIVGLLLACSSCGGSTSAPTATEVAPWTGDPIVETVYGAVRGYEDEANTWVWKAIPYAKPPVGDLRWKAPRDPEPWEGIREKTEFCSPCTQYDTIRSGLIIGSEDCLYLNIWRPQSDETNLPVYVWIHGGGNSIGAAAMEPGTYGANLASKSNMVFVSMNYRLGPFGWFTHPALRSGETGDETDDSGNYGTLDLIQALRWIHDNITAFGGDPGNVTITGESAGAINVLSLMISPMAENLFHRAMAQSGMKVALPMSVGEASAEEVLLKLLVNDGTVEDIAAADIYRQGMSDAEIEAYLRSKSAEELLACYEQMGFGTILFPNIFRDGTVIAADGFDTFRVGTYPNKVPIILGSTKEELKLFLFMDPSFAGKDELYQIVASYGSDFWKASGIDDVARELSSHEDQPGVYVYQFLWGVGGDVGESPIPDPWGFKLGACHSLDVPFFLGNDTFNGLMTSWVFTEENRPGREALSDAMMAYVAQFVRTGDPDKPRADLPEWKPWTDGIDQPKCILFDADGDVADIAMSTMELTISGVMETMRSEVPEPLYSEALEYLSSFILVSRFTENGN